MPEGQIVDARDGRTLTWPQDFVNKVICGDVLTVLRQMPDNVIDCVVTSPPYWGLRAYPDTERWWGGDPACRHEKTRAYHRPAGKQDFSSSTLVGTPQVASHVDKRGAFCRCGAWWGQLGLEPTWERYVAHITEIFTEVKRVLAPHGSLWLNLGGTFLGSWGNYGDRKGRQRPRITEHLARPGYEEGRYTSRPPQSDRRFVAKHKLGLPWRVRFALNDAGWISRADVVWHKPNALPSSVKDRVGTRYEMLFHLVKSPRYFFDLDAIRLPHKVDTPQARRDLQRMLSGRKEYGGKWAEQPGVGRAFVDGHELGKNPGDVWAIPTRPFKGAHFAVFPPDLCVRPILATCPEAVCRVCRQPRVPIRELPAWYKAFLGKGSWADKGRGDPKELAGCMSPGASVSRPVGGVVGYRNCECGRGFEPGIVLDPFCGSGTTVVAASRFGRRFIGLELHREYCAMAGRSMQPEGSRHADVS